MSESYFINDYVKSLALAAVEDFKIGWVEGLRSTAYIRNLIVTSADNGPWYFVTNDLIGGVCIMPSKFTPAISGDNELADFVNPKNAHYMATENPAIALKEIETWRKAANWWEDKFKTQKFDSLDRQLITTIVASAQHYLQNLLRQNFETNI